MFFEFSKRTVPISAIPILLLWTVSPAITWWISLPLVRRKANLTNTKKYFYVKLSRKTWSFFETFYGPEDHWLPPDNYQENPAGVIAHRTSPTNIGLALLANLSAYDFGYISAGQFIQRTSDTFKTMETLGRYQGHFCNWYDTQTLMPLRPFYISTVDSGNLAAHLLTLRQGILTLPDQKIVAPQLFEGISDTLNVITELADGTELSVLIQIKNEMEPILNSPPSKLTDTWRSLNFLTTSSDKIKKNFNQSRNEQACLWANTLLEHCRSIFNELTYLAPWLAIPGSPNIITRFPDFDKIHTLRELSKLKAELPDIPGALPTINADENKWYNEFRQLIADSGKRADERISTIKRLAKESGSLSNMEYNFLYNKSRHLLSVGYSVDENRRDSSFYDLLASEARLSNFVAIAQGQIPQESWFALGRLLTTFSGDPILLSWSGSMFEYLMPLLVMPTYENTLLDQTYKEAVKRQIEYGKQQSVPWGISESGYNTVDVNLNYQYRAFGVPGLGLKRGLAEDLVIAPYASALALMVEPEKACLNLQKLAAGGLEGKYGLYEAVDYTQSRLPREQLNVVIKSFMAHHQGMSLLSLAYLLLDRPMQRRFESDPLFEATVLLLQERIPKATFINSHTSGLSDTHATTGITEMPVRIISNPDVAVPEIQLLSNGRYNVMITNAGGGYSQWKDIALTRWHEDSTCDNRGTFCYIRDIASGEYWSAAYQPTLKRSKNYEAIFSEGHAEFRRRDQYFDIHTEIVVSPEDDIELRRVHITNRSKSQRIIDITSYAEVVLASPAPTLYTRRSVIYLFRLK